MTEDAVRRRVAELAQAGLIGDAAPGGAGRILDPIPVADPATLAADAPLFWFVPVAIGDTLAGFAQLLPSLELARYSTIPGGADLQDWIDRETVKTRAGALKRPDEALGDPVLTYDREPSRIVWAVPATDGAGASRRLYVVGATAYEERPGPDEPTFG